MIMNTLFLNITLLMWKQFLVFESFMILPLFRMRRILHRNFITLHISKILLFRNSGSIIKDSNTINCFHIKRVMFRKRVIIIMTRFINIIITTFYSISFITIIIISSNFVLIKIN